MEIESVAKEHLNAIDARKVRKAMAKAMDIANKAVLDQFGESIQYRIDAEKAKGKTEDEAMASTAEMSAVWLEAFDTEEMFAVQCEMVKKYCGVDPEVATTTEFENAWDSLYKTSSLTPEERKGFLSSEESQKGSSDGGTETQA